MKSASVLSCMTLACFWSTDEIRFKKGRLSKDEWFEVQKHAILGLHILEKVSRIPETAKFVAYQTHERENAERIPKTTRGPLYP